MNADTNQAGYEYVNESFVTITGGDLFTDVQLSDWLSVYMDMAYLCGTNWNPVTFVSAPSWSAADGQKVPIGHSEGLPNMYPFTNTVAIRVFAPETQRWLVEFSARIVAAQNYVAGSISELPNPGFAVFALRGRYKLSEHLRLSLALENLFNQPYAEPDSLAIINPQGIPTFVREPGFSALLGVERGSDEYARFAGAPCAVQCAVVSCASRLCLSITSLPIDFSVMLKHNLPLLGDVGAMVALAGPLCLPALPAKAAASRAGGHRCQRIRRQGGIPLQVRPLHRVAGQRLRQPVGPLRDRRHGTKTRSAGRSTRLRRRGPLANGASSFGVSHLRKTIARLVTSCL